MFKPPKKILTLEAASTVAGAKVAIKSFRAGSMKAARDHMETCVDHEKALLAVIRRLQVKARKAL